MTENGTVQTTRPDWFPVEEPYGYGELYPRIVKIVMDKPEGYNYRRHIGSNGSLTCLYWHKGADSGSGEPGCIIGHLLASLGAPPEFLAECDGEGNGSSLDNLVKTGKLDGLFEAKAVLALVHLQRVQDNEEPWTQALEAMKNFWAGMRSLERHQAEQAKS